MKFRHSKATCILQVVNTFIVLIPVLLSSQVEHRASPKTEKKNGLKKYYEVIEAGRPKDANTFKSAKMTTTQFIHK